MSKRNLVAVLSAAALLAACVPAGGGGGNFAGGQGFGGNSNQVVGAELEGLLVDGTMFVDWNDGYSECGFFGRDGWYEYDFYVRDRGVYYLDDTGEDQWWVEGDRFCIGDTCYFAEWASNDTVFLSHVNGDHSGYASLVDGPGYLYQESCGLN